MSTSLSVSLSVYFCSLLSLVTVSTQAVVVVVVVAATLLFQFSPLLLLLLAVLSSALMLLIIPCLHCIHTSDYIHTHPHKCANMYIHDTIISILYTV